jgi:hypothetical protein
MGTDMALNIGRGDRATESRREVKKIWSGGRIVNSKVKPSGRVQHRIRSACRMGRSWPASARRRLHADFVAL